MPAPTRSRSDATTVELEMLDANSSWELVRSRSVGRFAVNRRGACPLVVPVNYVVEGTTSILFRSGPGAKVTGAQRDLVAFQIDEIDPLHHTGWSVLVEGWAQTLADKASTVAVDTWLPGELPYVIRIVPTRITGRRIQLNQADTDGRGYR
jgi:hypothetical protein